MRTIVVGAGDVGQLVARKMLAAPASTGSTSSASSTTTPRDRRAEPEHVPLLGGLETLPRIVEQLDVDRVIVAFSNEPTPRR